jgi:predicted transcriptional regulator
MRLLNILKDNNIIKVAPEDHLSKVLSKLSTSHDAAFVFDSENNYKGIINPYFTMIKSSLPANTKAENCLTHTSKIYLNYPLTKVCELFIQSKIHYLPVFDSNESFIGIISARRILAYLKDKIMFKAKINEIISKRWKGLVTVFEDDTISHAIQLFKANKISKLIVVDHNKKLRGVLSYYDLIKLMINPKYSSRRGERTNEKVSFYNYRVKNFAKNYVLTLSKDDRLMDVINLIINKKIGSVIIVNKEKKPDGIVTTRDILNYYINHEKFSFVKSLNPFTRIFKK